MSDSQKREHDPHTVAFLVLAGVLALLLAVQTLNQQWSSDFWAHLATVRAIAERPWRPLQPFTGVDVSDPLLSPYMLLLGLAARWFHADPIGVLSIAGLFNLGLWLFAFRRFVLVLTANRGAPVWALLMTLCAWGIGPWRWSGYFNLGSIGFGLPYPSMFASAVAMLALASGYEWLVDGGRRHLVLVGVAVPLILLTHPFTFLWAGIGGAAVVIGLARRDRAPRIGMLAGVAAGGVALSLLWPFYSLLDLAAIGSQFDSANHGLYSGLVTRTFLVLPGLVALGFRARRNPRDPLLLMFVGTAAMFALGGLTHHWSLGRVFPGMMLAAHVALGAAVASVLSSTSAVRHRRVVAAAVTGLLLVGLMGSARGLVRMVPRALIPGSLIDSDRLASIVDPYRPLFELLGSGGGVVASPSIALEVGAINGHVLVPPVPSFLEDVDRRLSDQATILDPSTEPAERRALLARDYIRFVVITPSEAEILGPSLNSVATTEISTSDYVVFEVT